MVGDEESAIVEHTQCAPASLHLCLHNPALIGPIHGDITAYCVAMAFGGQIDTDPRALAILYEGEDDRAEMNEAHLRMNAHSQGRGSHPLQGAGSPRLWIGNVIVRRACHRSCRRCSIR